MNTADRSVEALDTALRRRFAFVEMPSQPEKLNGINLEGAEDIDLVQMLEVINKRIELLIDKDHQIGHSFFINLQSFDELKSVLKNKIIPLLEEYFFGDFGKIGLVLGERFITVKNGNENKGIHIDIICRRFFIKCLSKRYRYFCGQSGAVKFSGYQLAKHSYCRHAGFNT